LAAYLLLGGRLVGHGSARGYAEEITIGVAPVRPGRISEVRVALGAAVVRGDELARLDTTELDAHRARLEAERDVARAKLAAAGGVQDAAVLRSEVWQLRTVAAARRDRAELAALDRELRRLEGLYRDKLVRASDIEPVRRQHEALAARVNTFAVAAQTGRAGLGSTGALQGAASRGDRGGTDAHAAVVEQRLEPLREQLRVAEATLAELDVQRAAAVLRAPADGVVASVDHRPGEAIAAGMAVLTLSTGRANVVVVFVAERNAAAVRVGDQMTVSGRSFFAPRRSGRVIEAAPDVAELPPRFRASPTVPLWGRRVVVQTEGSAWLPGEEVRVRF
jgi:multidrug resistance efflux pump